MSEPTPERTAKPATDPTAQAPPSASPWIVEATAEGFQQQVFDRSREVPVVVDFWAGWCQPCRMLGPILERLAAEYAGKFVLVKAETDRLPEWAAQFNVSSIPAVFAVRDGQIVDFFVGVLPEEAIRRWLDALQPEPWELLCREAAGQAESDPQQAEEKLRRAIELAPNESRPKIDLARLLVSEQRLDEAATLVDQLEARGFLEPEAEDVKAVLDVRRGGRQAGSIAECRRAVDERPDDLDARLALAEALAAGGEHEEALETCLALVQADRHGRGEKARELMLDVFRLLGEDDERTHTFRRKLSTALY